MENNRRTWFTAKCNYCGIPVIDRHTCGACVLAIKQLTAINPRAYAHLAERLGEE